VLLTRETDRHGGDVTAGIVAAARWVAAELPVYALTSSSRPPTAAA
jgi:glutamine amidotransferase